MGHDLRSNQPEETGQAARNETGRAGYPQPLVWLFVATALCAASASLVLSGVMGDGAPETVLGKAALVLVAIAVGLVAGGAIGFAVRRTQAE